MKLYLSLLGLLLCAAATPSSTAQGGFAALVDKVKGGVVSIANLELRLDEDNPLLVNPLLRQLVPGAGMERSLAIHGVGSGVVIDAQKGFIVTNHHVVSGADRVWVLLGEGRRLQARVVGTDQPTDLALLAVPPEGLESIPLGDSSRLSVGDEVVAIGNPFGLGETVTAGVVSAIGRSGLGIEGFEDFIQTDASINPGNSGGALIDMRGELVGINTAIFAPSGGSIGIGFAIPISMVKQIVGQLAEFGDVRRGDLGIQIQKLSPELAEYLGASGVSGVVVTNVESDSAGAKVGIEEGDVIVEVDGAATSSSSAFVNKLAQVRAGSTVSLKLRRGAKALELAATLSEPGLVPFQARDVPLLAGVVLAARSTQSSSDAEEAGVLVLAAQSDSPAWNAGLRAGDVVGEVNGKRVSGPGDLELALEPERPLLLKVRRGDGYLLLLVR